MKKLISFIFVLIVCITIVFSVSGCNKQIFDFNYKFTNAYVKIGEDWVDIEIASWTDYEGEQLQLTLKDNTVIVVHSSNCILYKGTLPKA